MNIFFRSSISLYSQLCLMKRAPAAIFRGLWVDQRAATTHETLLFTALTMADVAFSYVECCRCSRPGRRATAARIKSSCLGPIAISYRHRSCRPSAFPTTLINAAPPSRHAHAVKINRCRRFAPKMRIGRYSHFGPLLMVVKITAHAAPTSPIAH